MQVTHYRCEKYGLMAIEDQRLKVASYDNLNDPYELIAASSEDKYILEALQHLKEDFSNKFNLLCFSISWQNPVI